MVSTNENLLDQERNTSLQLDIIILFMGKFLQCYLSANRKIENMRKVDKSILARLDF